VSGRLSPTVRRRRLRFELRKLRDEADLTIEDVAGRLECSPSKISRIETGQVKPTPRDVRDLLDIYGVDGSRSDWLIQLARDARAKGWWAKYGEAATRIEYLVGLEAEATTIRQFELIIMPGLLQTEAYARAIFSNLPYQTDTQAVTDLVNLRLERQRILLDDDPPEFHAILDEGVLHRLVGGRAAMIEQLDQLMVWSKRPNVNLQVLPFDQGEHEFMTHGFAMLDFADQTPSVVHVEAMTEAVDRYFEDPSQTTHYSDGFDLLRRRALSLRRTTQFLLELRRQLATRDPGRRPNPT
jgi:transcriptional regulator with XRE-family HTH domain